MSKTINYKEGSYNGEVNEKGQRHGYGTFYWDGNIKFSGKWKDNEAISGKLYWSNGDIYEGTVEYINNSVHVNGKGTTYYKTGEIYVGKHQNGNPNGKGTMYYTNGSVYKGDWNDGYYFGNGKLSYLEGFCYVGFFKEEKDKVTIYGKKVLTNGSYYEGTFYNHLLQGRGKLFNSSKTLIYDGDFKDGKKHGLGKYYYLDGSFYDGQWQNDFKHGKGFYKYLDGSVFEGTWKNDKCDGKCVFTNYSSNEKTTYLYKDGIIQEIVNVTKIKKDIKSETINFNNGDKYEGQVSNGKPHGLGKYYKKTKDGFACYEGSFVKGQFSGYGSYVEKRNKYVGQFKKFKRHGYGSLIYGDTKAEVKGRWKNDNFYGFGYFENYFPEIQLLVGLCKNNKFIGKVSLNYDNGNYYVGTIKNLLPEGYGLFSYKDSCVVGNFKNGKPIGEAIMLDESKMYECFYKNGNLIVKKEAKIIINKKK